MDMYVQMYDEMEKQEDDNPNDWNFALLGYR